MAEVGLLAPDLRVELIEGAIIDVPSMRPPDAAILSRLNSLVTPLADIHVNVRVRLPLRLGEFSEPTPDLALVKHRSDHYIGSHPTPSDALLVVEVNQGSLRFDYTHKLPLYSRHEVPEVWLVDVNKLVLHVFQMPQGGRYRHASSTPQPGIVNLRVMPNAKLDLTGLFEGLRPTLPSPTFPR
ncbi:MAG TPA: Uma2 family endonuclease [Steroidobacteraceae bacterium]|nr:Uma2 family endonuclease [Steroidobacteraceae bacterium]